MNSINNSRDIIFYMQFFEIQDVVKQSFIQRTRDPCHIGLLIKFSVPLQTLPKSSSGTEELGISGICSCNQQAVSVSVMVGPKNYMRLHLAIPFFWYGIWYGMVLVWFLHVPSWLQLIKHMFPGFFAFIRESREGQHVEKVFFITWYALQTAEPQTCPMLQ